MEGVIFLVITILVADGKVIDLLLKSCEFLKIFFYIAPSKSMSKPHKIYLFTIFKSFIDFIDTLCSLSVDLYLFNKVN